METFFETLEDMIQCAITSDFREIMKKVDDENIYVAVLSTTCDCTAGAFAVSTIEHMKKKYDKQLELEAKYPENKLNDFQREAYVKWTPGELGYGLEMSAFDEVSKVLYAKGSEMDDAFEGGAGPDETYEKYEGMVIETCISAFQKAIKSNTLGCNFEKITCFVSMADDMKAEEIENRSAKLLNSQEVYEKFIAQRTVKH